MKMEYIIFSEEGLKNLDYLIAKFANNPKGFGDMWKECMVHKKSNGELTINKEFSAFVNYRGDKLYKITDDVCRFIVAVIDYTCGGYHSYIPGRGVVINVCGSENPLSLQKFVTRNLDCEEYQ